MTNEKKETAGTAVTEPQNMQSPGGSDAIAQKAKAESKPKPKGKSKTDTGGASALKAVGIAACKRHGLEQVWVTVDGQAFPQESDAKAHARNLSNNETLKVSAK